MLDFRMAHLGGVMICAHEAIGPLASVAAGRILPTIIEDYAKLGDFVCGGPRRIEKNASLTAHIILAGHSVIAREAWEVSRLAAFRADYSDP
jgi:hypothetical protein